MRRRLRNALRRLRHGPEHRRPGPWASFERAVAQRSGPGAPVVEAAVRATLARSFEGPRRSRLEAIEARRRRLLDSDARVTFRVDGDPPAAGGPQVVGPLCAKACKPPPWALFLHHLAVESGARRALELGTCFGITAAYLAAAMDDGGAVLTLEGCEDYARIARETLEGTGAREAELVFGRFEATLPEALARAAPVDFLFVDGHHDEAATVAYVERAAPFLAPGAVVVLDDIRWSAGMTRAWEQVRRGAWSDLGPVGVCCLEP